MKQKYSSELWEEWIDLIVQATGITGRGIGRKVEGLSESSLGNYKRHPPPRSVFLALAKQWPVILREKAAEIDIDTSQWVELPLAEQLEERIKRLEAKEEEQDHLLKILIKLQSEGDDELITNFIRKNKGKILGDD